MATITLPTKFAFTSVDSFKLQRSTNTLRSRYTGQRQTIVFPFAVWMLEATLVQYDGVEAGNIRSFFSKLEGQKNNFRLPVPGYVKPSTNNINANCTVHISAAARAASITLTGLPNSTNCFNEGDYITINDELKLVTAAAASNATGQVTISFMPPLRKPATGGTTVILINPTILMNAAEDDAASWEIMAPVRHSFNFNAIEDVSI